MCFSIKNILIVFIMVFPCLVLASDKFVWTENWDDITGAWPTVPAARPGVWSTPSGNTNMYVRTDLYPGYSWTSPNGICSQGGWAGITRLTGALATDSDVVATGAFRVYANLTDQFVFYIGASAGAGYYAKSGVTAHYINNIAGYGTNAAYVNASGTVTSTYGWDGIGYGEGWNEFRWLMPKASGATTATFQVSPAGANTWTTICNLSTDSTFEAKYFTVATYYAAAGDNMSFSRAITPCEEKIFVSGGLSGDLNFDCYVDFKDFAILANQWLNCINPSDILCN